MAPLRKRLQMSRRRETQLASQNDKRSCAWKSAKRVGLSDISFFFIWYSTFFFPQLLFSCLFSSNVFSSCVACSVVFAAAAFGLLICCLRPKLLLFLGCPFCLSPWLHGSRFSRLEQLPAARIRFRWRKLTSTWPAAFPPAVSNQSL